MTTSDPSKRQVLRDKELAIVLSHIAEDKERLRDALARILKVNPYRDRDVAVFKAYFGIDEECRRLSDIARGLKTQRHTVETMRREVIALLSHPVWAKDRSEWPKGN